jgi:hypothetical protein
MTSHRLGTQGELFTVCRCLDHHHLGDPLPDNALELFKMNWIKTFGYIVATTYY